MSRTDMIDSSAADAPSADVHGGAPPVVRFTGERHLGEPTTVHSIALQTVDELGGPISVLTRQRADHVRLDHLLTQLEAATGAAQQLVLIDIYRLVFTHAFAEETVLWPIIRRLVPQGQEMTLRVEREHQQINELVRRLEAGSRGDAGRAETLARLVALLREDVRDEEDALLPGLQTRLSPRQLGWLGLAWEAVRRIAPTRAHPIVSRRPPGNVLAALPLSILDRSRDHVQRARYGAGVAMRGLAVVDVLLEKAVRAVEAVPGMAAGEDRSTRVRGKRVRGRSFLAFTLAGGAAFAGWRYVAASAARKNHAGG